MYAEERQQGIADLLTDRGRLSVAEIATAYDVTTETVRRDLSALERAGVVRRVHGGAVPAGVLSVLELGVQDREQTNAAEKNRIAAAALDLLPRSGGSILLDAGTTTGRLAGLLPHDRSLTVVTNAVPVAARLAGAAQLDLHLLPGRVRRTTQAAVGEETVAALLALRTDVAFLGTNGLSAGHGLSTPDAAEAAVKRTMIAAARRVVVLTDSSKLGQEQLISFAALELVDVVVTDARATRAQLAPLRERDIEVLVA